MSAKPYTNRTREHLEDCIRPVIARCDVFASELGIPGSTLRRRLQEEGTSWARLQQEEIARRVDDLRARGMPESAIAFDLGYESYDSFARASRTWLKSQIREAPRFIGSGGRL